MAARKGGAAAKPSRSSSPKEEKTQADEIRERITLLTKDSQIVVNPLDVKKVDVVSSGFLSLDDALGVGGFARGRIHAIEGEPDSGKTALTAAIIGAYQRIDPTSVHAFVSTEAHGADAKFLHRCGANVNADRLIILRPDSAEEADVACMILMGFVLKDKVWTRDGSIKPVNSITWDSWGGSSTNLSGLATLARIGELWRRLSSKAQRTNTTIFVTNHLHNKIGISFGDPRSSTGGINFQFMQTSRLWVTPKNVLKDPVTKRRLGHDLRIDVKRNKVAEAYRTVELTLNYSSGFDPVIDALNFLEGRGVTFTETASGLTYSFQYSEEDGSKEVVTEKGRDNFLEAIRDSPFAAEAFLNLAQKIFTSGVEIR